MCLSVCFYLIKNYNQIKRLNMIENKVMQKNALELKINNQLSNWYDLLSEKSNIECKWKNIKIKKGRN